MTAVKEMSSFDVNRIRENVPSWLRFLKVKLCRQLKG